MAWEPGPTFSWGAWQLAALTADFSAGLIPPQYRLSSDGSLIQFDGRLSAVTGGTLAAFTTAVGFRPSTLKWGLAASGSTATSVFSQLATAGTFTVTAAAGTNIQLEGLTMVLTP